MQPLAIASGNENHRVTQGIAISSILVNGQEPHANPKTTLTAARKAAKVITNPAQAWYDVHRLHFSYLWSFAGHESLDIRTAHASCDTDIEAAVASSNIFALVGFAWPSSRA